MNKQNPGQGADCLQPVFLWYFCQVEADPVGAQPGDRDHEQVVGKDQQRAVHATEERAQATGHCRACADCTTSLITDDMCSMSALFRVG